MPLAHRVWEGGQAGAERPRSASRETCQRCIYRADGVFRDRRSLQACLHACSRPLPCLLQGRTGRWL